MPRQPDPATVPFWQQRLERYTRSGLTVAAFCGREGISPATFYLWRRRLGPGRPSGARFVPVHLVAPSTAPAELVLPSGCTLRLSPGCDLVWAGQLLELLGVRPC